MKLTSQVFEDGETIPREHGYKEDNESPALEIDGVPDDAESLALVMDDPDAVEPAGKVWVHWLVWNIDPTVTDIPEGSTPAGAAEGTTDFEEIGYGGPAPPDKEHTYVFKLYALDTVLDLSEGASKEELLDAIEGHILAEAQLTGTYAP